MSMKAYERWLANQKAKQAAEQKVPENQKIENTVEPVEAVRPDFVTGTAFADVNEIIVEDIPTETTVASTEDKYIVSFNPLNLGTIILGENLPEVPDKVVAVTNKGTGVICDVAWESEFNANKVGRQRIGGSVTIPENYRCECPAYATASLKIKPARK